MRAMSAAQGPADRSRGQASPPEEVEAGPVLLRRLRAEDALPLAAAVRASMDHLRPWMGWLTPDAGEVATRQAWIAEAGAMWDAGSDYVYAILVVAEAVLAGTIGLHRRVGEGGIEIGYWVSAGHTRRGYATAASAALTATALALPGVTRVEIHCDMVNAASAGVPRKLGYRLDRTESHVPQAPAESGRRMIWVTERGGPAASGGASGVSAGGSWA
jgi:RimJ/RimL family protein N-acetyltransferase